MASVAPVAPKLAERLALRHFGGPPGHARQNQALRHFRDRQFALQRRGRGGERRNAGGQSVVDAKSIQPAHLLGDRAPYRQIAGMQPRDILTGGMRCGIFGLDLVKRQRRRVDDARAVGTIGQKVRRDDGPGVEANRAARQNVSAAHGDQIRRARSGADEMHGHRAPAFRSGRRKRAGHAVERDARCKQSSASAGAGQRGCFGQRGNAGDFDRLGRSRGTMRSRRA